MKAFDFENYKDFLKWQISANINISGYKGQLAQAAGCQRAYLSQILNSHVHLTPDQAVGLAEFWLLQNPERDYFLELVNLDRAGTQALKNIILERLRSLKRSVDTVTGRIRKSGIETEALQAQYYGSWHYSAIHILLTVSTYRSIPKIAERLNLSKSTVMAALLVLEKIGLVAKKGEIWQPVSFDLHLPKNSPLNSNNHMNWRVQAIQKSQNIDSDEIHFTSVYSLSEKDFRKLRKQILQLISDSRETALASEEQDIFSFCCDFFRI
jgi:uncharacterized protein (TIGR02147 family)